MRRFVLLVALGAAAALFGSQGAWAVSGGGYTTVNPSVDGPNHCKNGNPSVNCNIYDGKQYVWLNGGPATNGIGPDGQYFFAVLAPGGQPDPNDGGAKNLSDDFDTVANRTFTITGGEVSAYGGSHTYSPPLIRLFPYADTTNPGGVYILAICYLGNGYPVEPRSCKYDAFKVQKTGTAKVQAVLSGAKYLDQNQNGQRDAGEPGLSGWVIQIQCDDGTNTTVTTDSNGEFSFTTTQHAPSSGTTTCTLTEVQQSGWVQTGNTVDQSTAGGGATVSLVNFTYTVTIPNNAVSAVSGLLFGNFNNVPPVCPPPTTGTDANGNQFIQLNVQDSDTGLASINVTYSGNATVDISPASFYGSTDPVVVTATEIDSTADGFGLTFDAVDLLGATTTCDPVASLLVRESGASATQTFSGLMQSESNVTLHNGTPGVRGVELVVNGVPFRVTSLAPNETRTVDVTSAMLPGTANTVSVTVRGQPGARMNVLISN
jgi:hypothetical protein